MSKRITPEKFAAAILAIALVSVSGFAAAHSVQGLALQGQQQSEEYGLECPMHGSLSGKTPCIGLGMDDLDVDARGLSTFCRMPDEACDEMQRKGMSFGMMRGMHSMMR